MAQYLCIWVRAYWFSVTSFPKWLPGGHIRFFGFWTAWFRQCNSSLLWNFSFKCPLWQRQKPNDCQLCRFQNGCLVILNNVQLQSTHCYALLIGGDILVDHWSTISSSFWCMMQQRHIYLNSLRPSDAEWHWQPWSTLVKLHVIACCRMVPSHYLNQYWLITTEVLRWYSPGCSFTGNVQDIYLPLICIWKLLIKITAAYPKWRWVNCFMLIGSLHLRFSGPPNSRL